MLWLLIQIAAYVATTVLSAYLASKAGNTKASALGDFNAPTAEEGRIIPVIFGTVKLAAPNVVWYGDLKSKPLKAGGWGTFGFKTTYGYKYFLGMDLVLCHGPVDELTALGSISGMAGKCVGDGFVKTAFGIPGDTPYQVKLVAQDAMHFKLYKQRPTDTSPALEGTVRVGTEATLAGITVLIIAGPTTPFAVGDEFSFTVSKPSAIFAQDKAVPYSVTASGPGFQTLFLDANKLFGGDKQGGGIVGTVSFYLGTDDQPANAYLAGKLPGASQVPAYAGYCHAVFEQVYIGTSTSVPPFAFVVKRCPDPLAHGTGDIGGDSNPAWLIWDVMTSIIYGLGIPTSRFDADSFKAAATALKNEGLGMSVQINTAGSADSIISDVLRHISGVLYTDPATALWTLKLVRDDYDPDTLPTIGDADLLEPPEFSRISWDETLNEIKIRYCDRSLYFTPRLAQAQETANYAVRSQLASDTQDFLGLSNMGIAQIVAARELKAHSYPFARARLKTNRKAWNFRMGGVFSFSNSKLGIISVPFRISSINYGELTKGEIQIEAIEDAFGIAFAAYTPPESGGGWTDPTPTGPPPAPVAEELFEAPYALNVSPQRFVYMLAARGDGLSLGCDILSSTSGPLALTAQEEPFVPYGKLRDDWDRKAPGSFVVVDGVDLDSVADAALNLFVIDDEIMSFASATVNPDGSCTLSGVEQGMLDTLPEDHSAGADVWFFGDAVAQTKDGPYVSEVTVTAKALPINTFGETDAALVPSVALTTTSRATRPYPPGKVLVNGVYYAVAVVGDAVMTWADRHRVNQGTNLVTQDAVSFPGGVEGDYHVVVKIGGATVVDSPGTSGNTYTYSAADRAGVATVGPVTLEITPTNGTLTGRTRSLVFTMSGFGLAFGEFFGGTNE